MAIGFKRAAESQIATETDMESAVGGFVFDIAAASSFGQRVQADTELGGNEKAGIGIRFDKSPELIATRIRFNIGNTAACYSQADILFAFADIAEGTVDNHNPLGCIFNNRDIDFKTGRREAFAVFDHAIEKPGLRPFLLRVRSVPAGGFYMDG